MQRSKMNDVSRHDTDRRGPGFHGKMLKRREKIYNEEGSHKKDKRSHILE